MDSKTSSSSVNGPQEPSIHEELLMQQSLLFSDTLKDLKNLRKQLYSAADYFELAYNKEDQKQIVVENLKGYAIKALINTVDHLGSVAYKVDKFLDQKIDEVSGMGLRFSCSKQRLEACQKYINQGGLSQQSLVIKTPYHYKRYIFPVDEETMDSFSHAKPNHDSRNLSTENDLLKFKNAAQASIEGTPSSFFRERHSELRSPQFYSGQGTFTFTRTSSNNKPEKRSSSPQRSPIMRSGSLLKRPISPTYANALRRYPSEPRRSVSLSMYSERDKAKDSDQQYSTKSKRLFTALLSMRKSRKEGSVFTCLDQI
ncbi:PREDICTED: protein ABIL2-like [Populus euphratica]|uniref:Protein ABIL2-like n=1 Tax=Populus euphratica TaxID=75702 RepID=A0AAJ6UBF0_POPEU|nr:PREDICTED: protein ABIL2-like [Populus euphratica]XP_011026839.1 PREDICTED: protein ABIL2-like [Populus euphratica]XP_011026840.1 PREDICTED: protein ABIL2-like [Populus euphratica]XP_011026842.1 PREDICTED: protein ABIL2-like [Populus euphratica]